MPEGGLWKKLGALWRGFLALWVGDVEKKHPEIAYENAIRSVSERYVEITRATADIMVRRAHIRRQLAEASDELARVESHLRVAVEHNRRELGIVLVQKRRALSARAAELEVESRSAIAAVDRARASLLLVKAERDKLVLEKKTMLARLHSAQATLHIQEQLERLEAAPEILALDQARAQVEGAVAEASVEDELRRADVDAALAELRARAGAGTAKGEWERLRAANAANAAGTAGAAGAARRTKG